MAKIEEIELPKERFRQVFNGPLADPRELKRGLLLTIGLAVIMALLGWWIGTWWSALLPIPVAALIGIFWAGLEPGHWFKYDARKSHSPRE